MFGELWKLLLVPQMHHLIPSNSDQTLLDVYLKNSTDFMLKQHNFVGVCSLNASSDTQTHVGSSKRA